jgi:hypothetical protein
VAAAALACRGGVGEPDPVRRGGGEVAVEQARDDREVVAAVDGPAWPRRDGADTMWRAKRSMRPRLAPRPSTFNSTWMRGLP